MPRHPSSAAAILGRLVICRTWRRFCDSHPVVWQLKVTDPERFDQEGRGLQGKWKGFRFRGWNHSNLRWETPGKHHAVEELKASSLPQAQQEIARSLRRPPRAWLVFFGISWDKTCCDAKIWWVLQALWNIPKLIQPKCFDMLRCIKKFTSDFSWVLKRDLRPKRWFHMFISILWCQVKIETTQKSHLSLPLSSQAPAVLCTTWILSFSKDPRSKKTTCHHPKAVAISFRRSLHRWSACWPARHAMPASFVWIMWKELNSQFMSDVRPMLQSWNLNQM